jgi:hypothetical protein
LIPKKENGIWETTFHYDRFQIRHSKTSDRYFFYYDDRYLEEISRPEMYEFFKRGLRNIGAFRQVIHEYKNGKPYFNIELKALSTFKREKP